MAVTPHPEDYGKPARYDPDFNGPLKHRSCTDVICLFLLLVFIGCWIGIGIYAYKNGDPNALLVPKDSNGGRCGFDSHLKNKPYLFFFDLTKCLQPIPFTGCKTPQVCVEKCPDKYFLLDSTTYYNPKDLICIDGVPMPQNKQQAMSLITEGKCAQWYLPSTSVVKRCLYNIADRRSLKLDVGYVIGDEIKLMQRYLDSSKVWLTLIIQNTIGIFTNNEQILQIGSNVADDIMKSWWKIVLGLILAMLVCIIYIFIMRWIAGVMVWLSIFGTIAILSVCIYFCTVQYKYYRDNSPNTAYEVSLNVESYLKNKNTWLAFLIISSVLLGIILLMLLFLRKRIVIAISLIKEASRAVSSVTSSLFFPIFPWCLQLGVISYALFVGLFLSTIGNPIYKVKNLNPYTCICTGPASLYINEGVCDPNIFIKNCYNIKNNQPCTDASCHLENIDSPTILSYLHGINIFGLFWLLFFVSALSEMILAATFATWYWTFKKSDVPFFTVTNAVIRTLRYHLGTLAFGSLIIAICRLIRVLLEYIDSKLKKYENPITKAILCCCKCFFWCLENFLKFINRNAYIMCAIHGKNFCSSAKDAFNLLMRNILRVTVLDKVTDFLLFLSKLLVTGGVVAVAYTIFVMDVAHIPSNSELNYNYIPVVVIGVGTFFITIIFFSVFTMAVDTLFLCFLEDSERNDGSRDKPYFMSRNLMSILGKKNKYN